MTNDPAIRALVERDLKTLKHSGLCASTCAFMNEPCDCNLLQVEALLLALHTGYREQMAEREEALQALAQAPVPQTIATDEEFRFIYTQGYRHALKDAIAILATPTRREQP